MKRPELAVAADINGTSAEKALRPPPCRICGCLHCWWDGSRRVHVVSVNEDGKTNRTEVVRDRGKCSSCGVSYTIYKDGHYPRRQYQLDLLANISAAILIGQQAASQVAQTVQASVTAIRRWTKWIECLIRPIDLLSLASKINPGVPAAAGISMFASNVGTQVLFALEVLGSSLVDCDVQLASFSGLGRMLEWQFRHHEVVVSLTQHLSPPMALALPGPSG